MNKDSLEFYKQHGGPIFEPGPGWGERLSTWMKSSFTTKILPILAIIVIVLVVASLFGNQGNEVKIIKITEENSTSNNTGPTLSAVPFVMIEQIVQPGDGYSLIARRAILDYAERFNITLSNGQRMYIEDTLSKTVSTQPINIGSKIRFDTSDLETLAKQAQALTPQQLQIWENYATRAGI